MKTTANIRAGVGPFVATDGSPGRPIDPYRPLGRFAGASVGLCQALRLEQWRLRMRALEVPSMKMETGVGAVTLSP